MSGIGLSRRRIRPAPDDCMCSGLFSFMGPKARAIHQILNFPYWDIVRSSSFVHNVPILGILEIMRLVGKAKIQRLLRSDESARTWLCSWVAELTDANWKQAADVNHQFPNARQSDSGDFVFPIANCNKEVCLQIAFQQGIAVITGLQ